MANSSPRCSAKKKFQSDFRRLTARGLLGMGFGGLGAKPLGRRTRLCDRHRSALRRSRGQIERARDEIALSNCGTFERSDDRAVIENQDSIATADQLIVIRRIEQDGGTFVGQPTQALVEFLFSRDVDAPSRVVQEDDPGLDHQPFADDNFLLIAARKRTDWTVGAIGSDLQELDNPINSSLFGSPVD